MNGKAERDNRALMYTGNLSPFLWAKAVSATVYLLNRRPTAGDLKKTHYEKWTGQRPSVDYLRVIGSLACAYTQKQFRNKIELPGTKCMLVGYRSTDDVEIYRLYDPASRSIKETHDVEFLESCRYETGERNSEYS